MRLSCAWVGERERVTENEIQASLTRSLVVNVVTLLLEKSLEIKNDVWLECFTFHKIRYCRYNDSDCPVLMVTATPSSDNNKSLPKIKHIASPSSAAVFQKEPMRKKYVSFSPKKALTWFKVQKGDYTHTRMHAHIGGEIMMGMEVRHTPVTISCTEHGLPAWDLLSEVTILSVIFEEERSQ